MHTCMEERVHCKHWKADIKVHTLSMHALMANLQHTTGTNTVGGMDEDTTTRVHPKLAHSDPLNITTSTHGISLEKAENASAKVSTLVSIAAPRPSTATAPSGSGVVMMPTMVPVNTDSRCQALMLTPAGGGMNQSARDRPTQMPRSATEQHGSKIQTCTMNIA
eukprot:1143080-Pelagomonas_calceolata.AAC.4